MKTVSYSEIETFMRCSMKHHYKYTETLVGARLSRGAMHLGTVYHKLQELRARGQDFRLAANELEREAKDDPLWDLYTPEDQQEVVKPYRLASGMVSAWQRRYPEEEEYLLIEESVEANGFSGTPDAVVQYPEGVVIRDYKTTSSMPWQPMLSFQPYFYMALLDDLGYDILGFEYCYARSKLPSIPKLTVKGDRISGLKTIDTTAPVLLATAREYGLVNDPDVRERYNELLAEPNPFFMRTFIEWNPDAKNRILQLRTEWRKAMAVDKPRMTIQPYGGFDSCSSCDYAPLCTSELRGTTPDWRQYVTRDQ